MPEYGSSEQIFASSSADFNMRSIPAGEKSLEYVLAARCPKKTRTPIAREPDSFRVSTWPNRTTVENSSPSRTTHSAAEAPPLMARPTTSAANSLRSIAILLSEVSSVVVILENIGDQRSGIKRSAVKVQIAEVKAPDTNLCNLTSNLAPTACTRPSLSAPFRPPSSDQS